MLAIADAGSRALIATKSLDPPPSLLTPTLLLTSMQEPHCAPDGVAHNKQCGDDQKPDQKVDQKPRQAVLLVAHEVVQV